MSRARPPDTRLTGFLGRGRTTLLHRTLSAQHGQRVAVIENEFGDTGIDNDHRVLPWQTAQGDGAGQPRQAHGADSGAESAA